MINKFENNAKKCCQDDTEVFQAISYTVFSCYFILQSAVHI